MLQFIANNIYIVLVLIIVFTFLWIMGGEDIVFFRKKKYPIDPNANETLQRAVDRFAAPREYRVLGPTTIEFEGETHYFDAILLSLYGTVAFKAAPWGGEIYGDPGEETWLQVFEGARRRFDDPTKDLAGVAKFFRDIYRAEKVKYGKTDAMVVFTNKKTVVAVPRTAPVCTADDLGTRLEKNYLADNSADIAGMRRAIDKYTK